MMGLSGAGFGPTPGKLTVFITLSCPHSRKPAASLMAAPSQSRLGLICIRILCGGLPGGRRQSQATAAIPKGSVPALGGQSQANSALLADSTHNHFSV